MKPNLFSHFSSLWVPLCLSHEVVGERATSITLANERIVLFRDAQGCARALIDRCPHRGVALSLGRMEAGEITCPFHGWRFDGQGRCQHVPWNPDAKRDQLSAVALPLRESAGLIWLFTGREAIGEPRVPDTLLLPDSRVTAQSFHWQVHWTRVMENMLDTPHLPFVHARTIGKQLRGRTSEKMEMVWRETEFGAEITAHRSGEAPRSSLRYHYPNIMELVIDPGGRVLRLLAVCSPVDESSTRLTIYTIRDFACWRLFDPLFARANARIVEEDRTILESSLPRQVPPASEERSVATDGPTLAFRKIWLTRIEPVDR